jgi:hypothetical protein
MGHFQRILGLTGGLFFVTNIACGPATVYVQPAPTLTLEQIAQDEVRFGARRPAHGMEALVRGDEPTKKPTFIHPRRLPEAYTLDGSEGTHVSEYHLGYAAQRLIRLHYADAYPAKNVPESYEVSAIVDAAGGSDTDILEENRTWPVDIADVDRRFVFEVVPPGKTHQAEGKEKANLHAMLVNAGLWQKPQFRLGKGYSGELGVRFAENAAPWKLSWETAVPGVVQYHWQALTVATVTEESCRNAYLAKLWHDVTPREMAQYAGPLHRVVEELVQAREKLGRTRAAIKMPVVPGRTLFDYLDTVAKWSAHDERRAQLLPVMYGPPVTVVPRKQFVAETNGEDDDEAEGLFDLKGKPGRQPDNLHMGNSAHRLIGKRYELLHPRNNVFTNWTNMSTIVNEVVKGPRLLKRDEALLRPDIVNVKQKIMYEIKSSAPGRLVEGQAAVNKYLATLNQFLAPADKFNPGMGFSGNFWVRFDLTMPWWRIEWDTTSPGVVQYKWKRLNSDELDEPTIVRGLESGKYTWVDLTEGEIRPLAQECARFAKAYAEGSEKLYKVQMVSSFVIESIGHAAFVYLNAGLGTKSNAAPRGATQPNVANPSVQKGGVRFEQKVPPKTQNRPNPSLEPDVEPEFEPNVANRMRR